MRQVMMPLATRWLDLFNSEEVTPLGKLCPAAHVERVNGKAMAVSSFMSVSGFNGRLYFRVSPKPETIKAVLANTVFVEDDRMNWECIVWDHPEYDQNGTEALVLCQHSLIIGNVWLARIQASTIPGWPPKKGV